jgi:hypothetical protein
VKVTIGIFNHPDLAHLRSKDSDPIDVEVIDDSEDEPFG